MITLEEKLQNLLDEDAPYAPYTEERSLVYDEMDKGNFNNSLDQLVEEYGWTRVHNFLVDVLANDDASYADWWNASNIFLDAAMGKQKLDSDLIIGLVYERLPIDTDADAGNMAWSLVTIVKNLDYMESDYNPRNDPKVQARVREKLGASGSDIGG